MAIHIRQAIPGDLTALVRLEDTFPTDRLNRASFRHLLRHGHADIRVCESGGTVAGNVVVLYRRGAKAARLYSLVVHPDHRQRGIARALLAAAETAAADRRRGELRLEVRPNNLAAIGLYQKAGYRITGKIKKFYEDGTDALKMSKHLAGREESTGRARRPQPPASGVPCPKP